MWMVPFIHACCTNDVYTLKIVFLSQVKCNINTIGSVLEEGNNRLKERLW